MPNFVGGGGGPMGPPPPPTKFGINKIQPLGNLLGNFCCWSAGGGMKNADDDKFGGIHSFGWGSISRWRRSVYYYGGV